MLVFGVDIPLVEVLLIILVVMFLVLLEVIILLFMVNSTLKRTRLGGHDAAGPHPPLSAPSHATQHPGHQVHSKRR